MAYKSIEDRRTYHREYMQERRAFYREHHLCTECGREDAYTLNGHPRCFVHTHYRRTTPIEYIKPEKRRVTPARCLDGFCHMCGKPYMEGVTKWDGYPIRLCERCYKNLTAAAEKGRAAYKEKYGETWGQTQYRRLGRKNASENTEKSSPPSTSLP